MDLIFTNEEGMVKNIQYHPVLGNSDHVVIRFTLSCYTEAAASLPEFHTITDFEHLSTALRSQSWSDMCSMNLDEAYETFKT